MAVEGISVRYQAFVEKFARLVDAVKPVVVEVAVKAFAKYLISENNKCDAENLNVSDYYRASALLSVILNKIKQNDALFDTFVAILQDVNIAELAYELKRAVDPTIELSVIEGRNTADPDSGSTVVQLSELISLGRIVLYQPKVQLPTNIPASDIQSHDIPTTVSETPRIQSTESECKTFHNIDDTPHISHFTKTGDPSNLESEITSHNVDDTPHISHFTKTGNPSDLQSETTSHNIDDTPHISHFTKTGDPSDLESEKLHKAYSDSSQETSSDCVQVLVTGRSSPCTTSAARKSDLESFKRSKAFYQHEQSIIEEEKRKLQTQLPRTMNQMKRRELERMIQNKEKEIKRWKERVQRCEERGINKNESDLQDLNEMKDKGPVIAPAYQTPTGAAVKPTALSSDLDHLLISMALINLLDWHKLGLLLGIKKIKLDVIRLDFDKYGSERQRDEMIDLWLHSDRDASWEKLCTALENMDQNTIAEHIRTRYSAK